MAKLLTTNNIKARKCVSTIVRSLLEKQKIHEHNDKELDYLIRPEFIVHANMLKQIKEFFIFRDDMLVKTVENDIMRSSIFSNYLISDFAKEYTGSNVLKFKATLEQPEFITTFELYASTQSKILMHELESILGLMLPDEFELHNPDSLKRLKDVFIKKNITLPEKVTVNELLKKLSIIYVYPMCKQLTKLEIPDIMHPFSKRDSERIPGGGIYKHYTPNVFLMCGKRLGSDYVYSQDADSIEEYLKTNEEYDENDAKYLSFLKTLKPYPGRTIFKCFQFDFGAFAKLLDTTEVQSNLDFLFEYKFVD